MLASTIPIDGSPTRPSQTRIEGRSLMTGRRRSASTTASPDAIRKTADRYDPRSSGSLRSASSIRTSTVRSEGGDMKGRKAPIGALAATVLLLVMAAAATAGNTGLSDARAATAQFHQIDAARAAGYTVEVADLNNVTCIDDSAGHTGGMGIHFLNPSLLDANVDESTPELVIYEPTQTGRRRLVAVEYLVVKSVWDAAHGGAGAAAPRLF